MQDIAQLSIRVDSSQVTSATRAMDAMGGAGDLLEGILKKVAAAWASWEVAKKVSEATQLAARYETLGVVMGVMGNNAGYTKQQMAGFQAELEKTGISMIGARDSLNMMAAAQLDLGKSAQLARVAQDAAVIGGINSSEAFQRMVVGITSGQTEILRTMGLLVNFEGAYQRATAQAGRALTETEKLQIRFNLVLQEGQKRAGAYEAAMGTAGKQALSAQRYLENLQVRVGDAFMPAYRVLVEQYTSALKTASEWFTANSVAVGEFGTAMADVVRQGGEFFKLLGDIGGGSQGAAKDVGALTWVFRGIALIMAGATDALRAFVGEFSGFLGAMVQKIGAVADFTTRLVSLGNWKGRGGISQAGKDLEDFGKGLTSALNASTATGNLLDKWLGDGRPAVPQMMASHASAEERAAIEAANAANAKKRAQELADAKLQELAGQRKTLLQSLKEEAATYGMTKDEILKYNAARLGLGGSEALARVLAHRDIAREARLQVDAVESVRIAQRRAFEERQQDLEFEASANEEALNAVVPYRQELMALGRTYEALNIAMQNGTITQAQFAKGEEELLRKTQQTLPVMTEMFGDLRDTIQDWSRSSTEAFLDLAFKGKASFTDLINSMLRDLARLAVQRNVMEPLFNYLGGVISSGFGGSTGTTATTGGTAGGGLNWGEASMQAPLKGAQTSIVVNVNQAKGDVSTNAESSTGLGRKIEAAVKSVMVNEMRPGGLLARA